jgi:protein-disulfide isomerase
MDVKNNPVVQLLLAVVIFLLGAAMGGMYVKIQYLEGKMGVNKGVQAPGVADAGAQGQAAPTVPTAPVAPTTVNVAVTKDDPIKGDANAKLTVVEFADYQCPFCERFFTQVMPSLQKDYIDTGKIKFVFKNLAFLGQESTDAANAAKCAQEQNKFWEFHDYLYSHQGQENSGAFSVDNLKKFAGAVGLAQGQFDSCLDSKKYDAQVQADNAEANKNGFNSTPSTAIGSTPLIGAQPYAQFKAAIEAELAKK